MATNLETLLLALTQAVEAIAPTFLASVPFRRWRGPGPLDRPPLSAKPQPRMRQFQWKVGRSLTPRTLSGVGDSSTWLRNEFHLIIGYDLHLPRPWDTNGLGIVLEQTADQEQLWKTIVLGNPISASTFHSKRLIPLDPWAGSVGGNVRVYGHDLEYLLA